MVFEEIEVCMNAPYFKDRSKLLTPVLVEANSVCEELCRIGDSVGFRCYFKCGMIFCLRDRWEVHTYGRYSDSVYGLMSMSELVLEVRGELVVCGKCRWGTRDVSWELCDPRVFEGILRWFQIMAHRRDYGFG